MSDTTIADTIAQTDSSTRGTGWLRSLENPKYLQHLLLVPVLVFFIVWNVIPLFWLVGLSFYKYVLVTGEIKEMIFTVKDLFEMPALAGYYLMKGIQL